MHAVNYGIQNTIQEKKYWQFSAQENSFYDLPPGILESVLALQVFSFYKKIVLFTQGHSSL